MRHLVINEQEKGRRERIILANGAASLAVPGRDAAPARRDGQRIAGLSLGGLGVAGVVVGSVFGALATAAWNDQKSACGTPASCTSAGHAAALGDHSTLLTDGAVSTAAFIAGGVLLSGGAVLFFTAPGRASPATAFSIAPAVSTKEASMILRASF